MYIILAGAQPQQFLPIKQVKASRAWAGTPSADQVNARRYHCSYLLASQQGCHFIDPMFRKKWYQSQLENWTCFLDDNERINNDTHNTFI